MCGCFFAELRCTFYSTAPELKPFKDGLFRKKSGWRDCHEGAICLSLSLSLSMCRKAPAQLLNMTTSPRQCKKRRKKSGGEVTGEKRQQKERSCLSALSPPLPSIHAAFENRENKLPVFSFFPLSICIAAAMIIVVGDTNRYLYYYYYCSLFLYSFLFLLKEKTLGFIICNLSTKSPQLERWT